MYRAKNTTELFLQILDSIKKGENMDDNKEKENPTKKLQNLVKKRDVPIIVFKQNSNNYLSRKSSKSGFSGNGYSSDFEE